jgi:radical SAM superfamily enzyme YgiQ (UPF0313 family)
VEAAVKDFISVQQDLIYVVDDNFVGYSPRAREHALNFFKGIVEKGVDKQWAGSASMNIAEDEEVLKWAAKSGCKLIFLGIESELIDQLEQSQKSVNLKIGVDRYQEVYDKIHHAGISVLGAFIFGLDNDTPETITNRTNYILQSDIDIVQASILTPLPGTQLFKRFEEEGRLLYHNYPEDWEKYNYAEVVFHPHKMSPQEFKEAVNESWEKIYDLKHLKKKFLQTMKLAKDPGAAIWAFTSNLHLRNFVFEGNKEFIDARKSFPELFGDR